MSSKSNDMASLNSYLNFDGQCEEAMTFYAAAFGAEMKLMMRFSDMPMEGMEVKPEHAGLIMHAAFEISNGVLMASDIMPGSEQGLVVGNHNIISISPESRQEADQLFKDLSAGGKVEMPMHDAEWGDYFGMFKDRYGVSWMINFANV